MPRTLAAYLADLSQEELVGMRTDIRKARERLTEEARNLEFEEGLIAQALSRKARRTSASVSGNRITRQQVLDMIGRNFDGHFAAPEALQAFENEGITIAAESLRQHLRKLVADHKLLRDGNGYMLSQGERLSAHPSPAQTSPNGANQDGEIREIGLESGS